MVLFGVCGWGETYRLLEGTGKVIYTGKSALLRNGDIEPQEKIAKVLAIYDSLGVKEKTEEEIDIHFSKAIASLSSLTVAPERMEPILELARSLMNRNR
jgi:geranylgeranyl diphosphate synthase type II